MRVVIFGATGFVGAGVLAQALLAQEVEQVVVVGRTKTTVVHPKLKQVMVPDVGDLAEVGAALRDGALRECDACFWCLGISSAGLDEDAYASVTHDLTLRAARTLLEWNPGLCFCFLSGAGADGKSMWARVKRRTEEDLRALGLGGVIVFRPAFIRATHPARLRGLMYRIAYFGLTAFSPILRLLGVGTSNAEIGGAMIVAVREGLSEATLSSRDINRLASRLGEQGQRDEQAAAR